MGQLPICVNFFHYFEIYMFQWLSKMNLMDYSLLIGIHDCDRAYMEAEQEQIEENGATGTNVSVRIPLCML